MNIAEVAGDRNAQFNHYLYMAWDSRKECVVCSTIANQQDYSTDEVNSSARIEFSEPVKMTTSL